MATVAIIYVGPHDGVEIAATGQVVGRGATIQVDAELVGRAPSGDDLGEGLLAQPSNWVSAEKPQALAPAAPEKDGK